MVSINHVILLGLVSDVPQIKTLPSGMLSLEFSIVTQSRYKDKIGNYQDSDTYHKIVLYGKQCEDVSQQLLSADKVHVIGRIQTDSYTDKNGQKQRFTKIVASSVVCFPTEKQTQIPETTLDNTQFVDDLPF